MKILYIGNSFSTDATRYLQSVAGDELFVRNLYIGGCSLSMHAENIAAESASYEYQIDALPTEMESINNALLREKWDVISVQQVSGLSGISKSYEPHLEYVLGFVKRNCPDAKIVFHRTWAYEQTSTHSAFPHYDSDRKKMFSAIVETTSKIAEKYSLDIIPAGNAVEMARELAEFDITSGGMPITRDGFHLSFDYGRYLAALVHYKFHTGKSCLDVKFAPEGTDPEIIEKLKAIADKAEA